MMTALLQDVTQAQVYAEGMTPVAWTFLGIAWGGVFAMVAFSFYRIFTTKSHFDPDGVGPEHSPVPSREGEA